MFMNNRAKNIYESSEWVKVEQNEIPYKSIESIGVHSIQSMA